MKSIRVPFSVDGGSIASTTDYDTIIQQKIIDVLVTSFYERPMRPAYGAGTWGSLFEAIDELEMADFRIDASNAVSKNVSAVTIRNISFDQTSPGLYEITVFYSTELTGVQSFVLPIPSPFDEESSLNNGV